MKDRLRLCIGQVNNEIVSMNMKMIMKYLMVDKVYQQLEKGFFMVMTMAVFMLGSCAADDTIESTYLSDYRLYVIGDDSLDYNTNNVSAPFNSVEKTINAALDNYAVDMLADYNQISTKNTLVSPVNATVLYSMMSNFVEEGTTNSFLQNLGLEGYDMSNVNSFCRKLNYQNKINGVEDEKNSKFAMSTNIWIQEKSTVYKSFLSMAKSYDTQVKGVDFQNTSDLASINKSIKDQASNTIGDIERSSWNGVSSIVTSTMDFKKQWKIPMTSSPDGNFINADGSLSHPTMLMTNSMLKFKSFSDFNMVELPYNDNHFSVYIVYPKEANFMMRSLDYIQKTGLEKCIALMDSAYIDLQIPSFKYEGITELNPQNSNQVSSISKMYNSNLTKVSPNGFKINNVYQSYSIELTKAGTSVSVNSTGVVVPHTGTGTGSGLIPGGNSSGTQVVRADFHVSHPFAVFIRDNHLKFTAYACCIKHVVK